MFFNDDSITIDMEQWNANQQRQQNMLRGDPSVKGGFKWTGADPNCGAQPRGCTTTKQCTQINKELDEEERRIHRLRREYDMTQVSPPDTTYMLDPTRDDGPKDPHVDPHLYALDRGGPSGTGSVGCSNRSTRLPRTADANLFRINPNARDNFSPEEEEWMLQPGSENIAARKRDVREREKLRIYPHMYQTVQGVKAVEAAHRAQENDVLRSNPSMSLTGVDYPIPMYFQLQPLNDPNRDQRGRQSQNIDYDMHLRTRSKDLPDWHDSIAPKQLMLRDNVDFSLTKRINGAILDGSIQEDWNMLVDSDRLEAKRANKIKRLTERAAGSDMMQPEHRDFTCQQTRRQRAQEEAVRAQPDDWYCSKQVIGDGCGSVPRVVEPQTMSERNVFGGGANGASGAQRQPVYPLQRDEKSSFFGLGPALPPPDPLLLSNVPSRLLMHRQAINASTDRDSNLQLRLQTAENLNRLQEGFEGSAATQQFPPGVIGASGSGTIATTGAGNGTPGLSPLQHDVSGSISKAVRVAGQLLNPGQIIKTSGQEQVGAPNVSSTSSVEFHVARSSLEKEMKQVISATLDQQRQALMQISDLRHALAGLQQRLVEDRAHNAALSVAQTRQHMTQASNSIGKLREVIHAVQARRKRALARLKEMLTPREAQHFETVLANEVQLMEVRVKQYHSQPPADKITAFRDAHFDGDGYTMGLGFYDYPTVGGLGNNKLKSLKVGSDVQIKLYERPRRGGKVLTYVGPRRISLLPQMWTSSVSGIEVLPKMGPVVTVWDAPFFQGGEVRLPLGFHDYPDVGGIGASNLKSISIPDGLEVTFYARPKKTGEKVTFIGPQRLSFLPADWNKKVFGVDVATKT